MSNVALPSDHDRESPFQMLVGVGHRRQITTIDLIFGTYTVVIAALAALAWLNGAGSPRSVVVFLAFLLANALISEISRRSAHPLRIEIGRAAAGAIIAPAAYVLADAPFSHWWPGFMIMCLGGNIILGLLTGAPRLGRVLVLYYVALLTLAEWLGTPSMNWYAFALNAGAVAMVGLLFAEIVSLLGMALASEREQHRQLALEKARAETLLQKEAEAALRASEEHFRSLIENASDAVAITDRSGVITYMGPSITRMLGYTPEELVGQHFAPIVHPDDLAAAGGALTRAAENPGKIVAADLRIRHNDGTWHILESVSKGLPNGTVVSNVRDVSKRRAAEERLRANETLYRSLIEASTDGITISNADGIFTYASPSFHHILGYAPEQLIGQPFAALIHPDDLVIVSNELAMQSADPNHVSLIEVRARHQDGSWRVIEASGKRLDDGTIAFSRDVTERKQIETALRAVATGIAANTGDDFLQSLVKYLAAALNVRYALIAEIADPTERRVRTLAFWNNDAPAPNIEYGLTGTPCEHVIEQNALRYYPAGVQATFPDDAILAQLHAESYMGVPLRNSVGEVFGHLAVLDERPMRDAAERRAILQIFAARVGAELERQRAEEKLRASEAHYRSLIENTSDGIAIIAADGAFSYINPAYERIWGWAATELIGQPFMELIHPDDLALSANNLGRLLTEADATVGAEIRVRHKDGSWRIVDGTAKRLPNGSIVSNSRDVTERHDIEQAVRAVAEGTAAVTGSDFFRSLVKHMAAALRVRYAYVTQSIDTPPHRLRMLACWAGDDFGANHQYALDGTPCERVIVQGELGFYPRGVYARFPRDQGLAGVEGYLGIPLTDASGQVLGNLVIMDDQPMADNLPDNPIVRIFAGRAGAELERQRAEDALRIAELRFRAVFDQPLLSVQICNPDGTMSQWNAATAQHYNILDDQQALTNNVQPLLGGAFAGQAAPIPPVPYDFPDGRRVWAQGFIYPVKDHAGAVREVMIMVQDITTQKEAEETLRRLNEELEERVAQRTGELNATLAQSKRLAAIIESTSDLVARADLQGTMIYMNRAGRRLVGLSDEEDIRRFSIADFYPPQVLPTIQARVGANIAQGIDADLFETLITDRDGRAIPVSLVGIVHRDPDGAPESLSSVIRDISAQKRIEHELKQAKEAAEEANRAKSTFLANMSHEIRTPMNGIIGMTDLLLDTELGPAQRDFVETIRTSGDALITIINDILDFSKIEAGRLDLEAQPLDLRLCVESALDVLAHRAAEKGLDLAVQIDANTPAAIVGDAVRLRQVLVNLLANAVKFTEQGEVVVTVRTEGRGLRTEPELPALGPQSSVFIAFSVRDTGIGIPPDRIDRLFQSFSQIDPSTTRQYGGTGLGLVISRRLAELMGGRMWVESAPGHGSTFHFTIQAEVAPSTPLVYLSGEQPQLRGKHVLVVDDHPTNRTIVCHQVASWGMTCDMAASGAEALALLQDGRAFDLAILDMEMPDMDGNTLAARIREQRDRNKLPLVLLTSLVQRASDLNGGSFAAMLTKPVKASQLYNTLVEVLMEQEQSTRAPRPPSDAPAAFDVQMAARMPLRILLAEDNLINQKVALLALGKLGYGADVAANGVAALDAVGRQAYDVVLMDVHMPVQDGLNATRRIRADAQGHGGHQPWIIAMTANAMQGDRELCLAAGMDDYIAKPVHVHELRVALERAGEGSLRDRPGPGQPAASDAIDATALAELRALGAGDDLIELFLTEAPATLAALRQAIAQGDASELRELAHSLKGSCRYLGARPLTALLAELEQIGSRGSVVAAAALLEQSEQEFDRVRHALVSYQQVSNQE